MSDDGLSTDGKKLLLDEFLQVNTLRFTEICDDASAVNYQWRSLCKIYTVARNGLYKLSNGTIRAKVPRQAFFRQPRKSLGSFSAPAARDIKLQLLLNFGRRELPRQKHKMGL